MEISLKMEKIGVLTKIFLSKFFDIKGVLRDVGDTFLDGEDFKLISLMILYNFECIDLPDYSL